MVCAEKKWCVPKLWLFVEKKLYFVGFSKHSTWCRNYKYWENWRNTESKAAAIWIHPGDKTQTWRMGIGMACQDDRPKRNTNPSQKIFWKKIILCSNWKLWVQPPRWCLECFIWHPRQMEYEHWKQPTGNFFFRTQWRCLATQDMLQFFYFKIVSEMC